MNQLAQAHQDRTDFMQALALASTAALNHADDGSATARLSRGEKTRRSLLRRWLALRARWVR